MAKAPLTADFCSNSLSSEKILITEPVQCRKEMKNIMEENYRCVVRLYSKERWQTVM